MVELNHQCSICGKRYHFCVDCGNAKTFTPWRTIVDTIEHYKIYIVIRDYENKYIDISSAKEQLNKIDLNGLDSFIPEIRLKIEEILSYEHKLNKKKK